MITSSVHGWKCLCAALFTFHFSLITSAQQMSSPNGKLSAQAEGKTLIISYEGKKALQMEEQPFASTDFLFVRNVKEDYRMLTGKRLVCSNEGKEYVATLGEGVKMMLRLYNDGIAFRYDYPEAWTGSDPTVFSIPEGTRRWMQQWTDSYEGFFPLSTTYKVEPVPSFSGISKSEEGYNNRWGYPTLLEPQDGLFVLLSEANIERGQSASCLYNDKELFKVVPADLTKGTVPIVRNTPWRVAIIGSLAEVVESTLITDVSNPCQITDTSWIQPGVVSWVYWAYNHGSNDYSIIKKYVDMAATLHLPYVLIDAEWDQMDQLASNEGKTIEDAVAYAKEKGVKPMIWYNSSVGWVDGAPTPKYRLNKPEDREKEFAWCEKLGVAGVKIDFFSGDNQMNMDYCLDLLESAARHHLLVNFHGATIPRGWQRTWPNLMSTEGVYGAEWYNNVPTFTAKAAAHNATLPFTRNVIGPMDYTPCAFSDSQHPHITTHAHELALTVLFESGLQHLADKPESFLAQPQEVQDFLSHLPSVWDETRFASGYPGESVVIARRSGNTWYIAGINGTDEEKDLPLLSGRGQGWSDQPHITAFLDAGEHQWQIQTVTQLPATVTCRPRGGFVFVVR
ncbi:MAG: glycoside hydrolase family 97 catalytic domain-containing protein [Prevotella sp.]|nr:glycoside hydrolase family 97 catalytic domain-containing protein [Prevotella sp.]